MMQERRTQARIRVEIPIRVYLPDSHTPVDAVNRDLSWGGMQFVVDLPLTRDSGVLRIMLPWKRDSHISLDATVARAQQIGDGRYLVAVRFTSVTPRAQARLEKLLKLLQSSGADHAVEDSVPLVSELEVSVENAEDFREMIAEIATGRLEVTVFQSYHVDQSIRLTLTAAAGLPGVRLRARITHITQHKTKDLVWQDLYTIRLEFEHPLEMIRNYAELLLDQLRLTSREENTEADHSEVPGWVNHMQTARNPVAIGQERPSSQSRPIDPISVLEARFPDVLTYLTAVWGHPATFEQRFQELTMGHRALPGGWPEDAWLELGLLQDVHESVYGRSPVRGRLT